MQQRMHVAQTVKNIPVSSGNQEQKDGQDDEQINCIRSNHHYLNDLNGSGIRESEALPTAESSGRCHPRGYARDGLGGHRKFLTLPRRTWTAKEREAYEEHVKWFHKAKYGVFVHCLAYGDRSKDSRKELGFPSPRTGHPNAGTRWWMPWMLRNLPTR